MLRRRLWVTLLVMLVGAVIFQICWASQKAPLTTFYMSVDSYDSATIDVRIRNKLASSNWPRNSFVVPALRATLRGSLVLGLMLDAKTSDEYILLKQGLEAQTVEIISERIFLMSSVINEGDQLNIRLLSHQQATSHKADRLKVEYFSGMAYDPILNTYVEAVTLGGIEQSQRFSATLSGKVKIGNQVPQQKFAIAGGLGRSTNTIPSRNWAWALDPITHSVNPFALLINLSETVPGDRGKMLVPAGEQLWMQLSLHDEANLTFDGLAGKISLNGKQTRELSSGDSLEIVTKASGEKEAARVLFSEEGIEINGVATSATIRAGSEVVDLMPKRGNPKVSDPAYWVGMLITFIFGVLATSLLEKVSKSQQPKGTEKTRSKAKRVTSQH